MASVDQVFVFHYGCDQNQKPDHKLKETELNKENKHSQINNKKLCEGEERIFRYNRLRGQESY